MNNKTATTLPMRIAGELVQKAVTRCLLRGPGVYANLTDLRQAFPDMTIAELDDLLTGKAHIAGNTVDGLVLKEGPQP